MNTFNEPPVNVDSPAFIERKLRVERQFASGVSWFTWIAALSAINTLLFAFKIDFLFIFGLGTTQLVDGIAQSLVQEIGPGTPTGQIIHFAALGVSLMIAGIFYLIGFFAKRRLMWLILGGMVLYVLDGLIFLLAQDYLGAAFHLYVLFGLFRGYQAAGTLQQIEESIRAAHPYAVSSLPTI